LDARRVSAVLGLNGDNHSGVDLIAGRKLVARCSKCRSNPVGCPYRQIAHVTVRAGKGARNATEGQRQSCRQGRELPSVHREYTDHAFHDGGSAVVISMVIQTTQPEPPEPNWTDDTPHLSRLDPTGADQSDAEHQPTDLAVGGSSPSRRATLPHVSRHVSGKQRPFGSSLD